jgi:hypothetical protein
MEICIKKFGNSMERGKKIVRGKKTVRGKIK